MASLKFAHLRKYRAITVTGPQRSGTTVAAKMIAADTGYHFVDENDYGIISIPRFRHQIERSGVVVQCPHMLRELVDYPPDDVLVVLMRRSLEDISLSEQRIHWLAAWQELAVFGELHGSPAAVKYDYWRAHPKPPHSLELEYESLRDHPLWVDDRTGFAPKQTER